MVTTVTGVRETASLPESIGALDNRLAKKGGALPPPSPGGGNRPPDDSQDDFSGDRYRVAMWVTIVVVSVTFISLTSIYIVRARLARDWQPIAMPRLLFLSTTLIVASSLTFHFARRYFARGLLVKYRCALWATLLLGLSFLGTQFVVWRGLAAAGLYLAGNPHSSFFYLLTGAHALHLLGGICGIYLLLLRGWGEKLSGNAAARRQSLTGSIALYWHFMDGLWLYLFMLLFAW